MGARGGSPARSGWPQRIGAPGIGLITPPVTQRPHSRRQWPGERDVFPLRACHA